jgi:hypothetical protein
MENPQDTHASKRFRWVAQPSEAELLGLPGPARRHTGVSFLPRQAPEPAPVAAPPNEAPPGRRLRLRDAVTVTAVGVAVWLALQGAGTGLPFGGSRPVAPDAVHSVGAGITLDRQELRSLPRLGARSGSTSRPDGRTAGEQGSSSPSPGGTTPDDPATTPLVQATIPGVGSVTIEEPDLSSLGGTPALPDTGDVLPETPTLPLP